MNIVRAVLCCALLIGNPAWPLTPARSTEDSDVSTSSLLDVYHQGKRSNCGSVALTKLIISKYGPSPASGVFSRSPLKDEGFSMLLMDGTSVTVTSNQLSAASDESKFSPMGDGKEIVAANALYAVMAVRRAGRNDGREVGTRAFKDALKTLGKGGDLADADVLPFLLGFKGFVEPVSSQQTFETYLLGSGKHIVFVTGQKYDEYGESGGEVISSFNWYYGTETMYRYAFAENVNGIIRQCSDGGPSWSPSTAVWRSCKPGEVTELNRK